MALGYQPNILARGLKTGTSRLVTCIVRSLSNPLIAEAVEGVDSVLRRHGYGTLVFRSGPSADDVSEGTEFAASYNSAGLIVFHPSAEHSTRLQRWVRSGNPTSFAIHVHPTLDADHVLMADEEAGYLATQYLLDHGHSNIALIIRSRSMEVYNSIVSGYLRALEQFGNGQETALVGAPTTVVGDISAQSFGYRQTLALLALPSPPSAILCAHNQIAIGVLRALREQNVSIPDDLSLLSFDRVDWMDVTTPQITSIGLDGAIVGQAAAEQILARIRGDAMPPRTTWLKLSLVEGMSVGTRR